MAMSERPGCLTADGAGGGMQQALLVLRALVLAGNPPAHVRTIFMTIRST